MSAWFSQLVTGAVVIMDFLALWSMAVEPLHNEREAKNVLSKGDELYGLSFGDVFRLSQVGGSKERFDALCLATALGRSPRGHRALQKGLHETDPRIAAFCASHIDSSADLGDIPALLRCAEIHIDNDHTVECALTSITSLLGIGGAGIEGSGRAANERKLSTLQAQLTRRQTECAWHTMSYVDYWGTIVEYGLREFERNPDEAGEFLAQSWFSFLESQDAERAAPRIVGWIGKSKPADRNSFIPVLVHGLQFYAGPLDVPKPDNIRDQQSAQQAVLAWWKKNEKRKPACWFLDRLRCRGYATGNPANARATAEALVSALVAGDEAERYAASMVMVYALPDGDCIAVDRDIPHASGNQAWEAGDGRKLLRQMVLCRAQHWCVCQSSLHSWNEEAGKYVRIGDGGFSGQSAVRR